MDIPADIGRLDAYTQKNTPKWRRSYNRYVSNGSNTFSVTNPYTPPVAWYFSQGAREADTGVIPITNVMTSIVDTFVSKISQLKVRPFANPVRGTFRTRKIARAVQNFLDLFYDNQKIYQKGTLAVRDSEIFERGHLWIDEDDQCVHRVMPWEYEFDPKEWHYWQRFSRVCLRFEYFPLFNWKKKLEQGGAELKPALQKLENDPGFFVRAYYYYDFNEGKRSLWIDGNLKVEEKDISYKCSPVATIWHSHPIKGGQAQSMFDSLYPIQTQIDSINETIHNAVELNPVHIMFVPKSSQIKADLISNRALSIYEYMAPNIGYNPVVDVTPRPMDEQYLKLLEFYINQAYQMSGISQLSAQSRKPTGLTSGVALDTLQDVESERFNVAVQDYINMLMDVSSIIIECFPDGANVLPKGIGRPDVKWKDIRGERDSYRVQFSAASSLSKDPKTKMEQIQQFTSMGLLPKGSVAKFLDLPDLEDATGGTMTAVSDEIDRIIERAAEDGEFDFYETVPLDELYQRTCVMIDALDAADEDPKVIDRLDTLMQHIKARADAIKQILTPPAPPAPAIVPAPVTPGGQPSAVPVQPPPQGVPAPSSAPAPAPA